MNPFHSARRLWEMDPSIFRKFLKLDQTRWGYLAWRLLLSILLMRPWQWRFQTLGKSYFPAAESP